MPTLFPVDASVFDAAPALYSHTWSIDRPASDVWAELVGDRPLHWCRGLSATWTSPRPFGVGATRQAKVFGGLLTVQELFFRWEEGQRYSFYVTEANVPFFKSLAEDYNVKPDGLNRCNFTWSIALEPTVLGRIGGPLNGVLFDSFFSDTARYFGSS